MVSPELETLKNKGPNHMPSLPKASEKTRPGHGPCGMHAVDVCFCARVSLPQIAASACEGRTVGRGLPSSDAQRITQSLFRLLGLATGSYISVLDGSTVS